MCYFYIHIFYIIGVSISNLYHIVFCVFSAKRSYFTSDLLVLNLFIYVSLEGIITYLFLICDLTNGGYVVLTPKDES
jgi:hypothetical protein